MARDTMTYESYEPDSFDNPPKGPVGVHRGARSVMARLCPFIVVILVAALCGVGAWAWISGEYKNVIGGSSQTATTSKSDSSSKAETKNSTKDDSSSTSTDSSRTRPRIRQSPIPTVTRHPRMRIKTPISSLSSPKPPRL